MSLWSRLSALAGRPRFQEPQETVFAFKALMQSAADEIAAGGELKPARVIDKGPNLAKVHIGWFKRRLLRGEFRSRA